MTLKPQKILMILAYRNFRDEEFFIPYEEFKKAKLDVTVCSLNHGEAIGVSGNKIHVDLTTTEAKASDYDAIVYVGGKGTPTIRSDDHALEILKEAMKIPNMILSAICWAPTILAKAGALKNKKATVWLGPDDEYGKKTNEILTDAGASYVGLNVVEDGNVITANGAHASLEFAQAILEKLSKKHAAKN